MKKALAFLVAAAFGLTVLQAQTTSEILGTVTDETGAVIAGARINVRNVATGIQNNTTSGEAGQFRIPLLQPGKYEVVVEKAGFTKLMLPDVEIQLNERANIPARLKVSATQETVTVTGEVPLVNTTNAEVGVNFDSKRIAELPLAPNSNIVNLNPAVGIGQTSSRGGLVEREAPEILEDPSQDRVPKRQPR
ncbi:MAG: carboxypeptidase regulatory-like domain-containing protein [Acidobacteria bacterium]|nr:carboxypeptidase regulatory-like domain-containing protein [Acidobacteriota bacterium]